MDDGDSKKNKQIKGKGASLDALQRYITNVSDVLSPLWVRRPLQVIDGGHWLILGCRYYFLFYFLLLVFGL